MQEITNGDILALIDQINQYKLGNVTKLGLAETLRELAIEVENSTSHDFDFIAGEIYASRHSAE